MKKLTDAIKRQLGLDHHRLVVTTDKDHILRKEGMAEELSYADIVIIEGTSLELRIHFETVFKENPEKSFIYITDDKLLPDILLQAKTARLRIDDLFPFFADKESLKQQSLGTLSALYQMYPGRVAMRECQAAIDAAKCSETQQSSESTAEADLQPIDWTKQDDAIGWLSRTIIEAAKNDDMEQIASSVKSANDEFQKWLDANYFARLNSSYLLRPNSVDKILPFIAERHKEREEKVALVVVDGMAYWQWVVLASHISTIPVQIEESSTLAWIPTVTRLSRQAIFRGAFPEEDYRQNPANEKKLWRDFWMAKGFTFGEIQYVGDEDEFAIDESTRRLALVTVDLDEKMHSSSDLSDLYLLTNNWARRFQTKVAALLNIGYTVYLTSDHGGVPSIGWRTLSAAEKIDLYADGSRGKRHLIFNNESAKKSFKTKTASEIELMQSSNWLVMRDSQSFDYKGNKSITHGGSNFMEVIVPFIKISSK